MIWLGLGLGLFDSHRILYYLSNCLLKPFSYARLTVIEFVSFGMAVAQSLVTNCRNQRAMLRPVVER